MDGSSDPPVSGEIATAAMLFDLARVELVDVLGTTPLAVLLRRAQGRAIAVQPGLSGFVVEREGYGYRYHLPSTWSEAGAGAEAEFAALVRALVPLLAELAGTVGVLRLVAVAPLWANGILREEDMVRW